MDKLDDALQELYWERDCLDTAIARLENLGRQPDAPREPGRRGRKSMPAGEREVVSARMKRYWAGRRESGVPAGQS